MVLHGVGDELHEVSCCIEGGGVASPFDSMRSRSGNGRGERSDEPEHAVGAAVLLGGGTAMVYPTLIAAVSDAAEPRQRARALGIYRFWRDFGFVLGALIAGVAADIASSETAILIVTTLTAASGLAVLATRWPARPTLRPTDEAAVPALGAADVPQRGRI